MVFTPFYKQNEGLIYKYSPDGEKLSSFCEDREERKKYNEIQGGSNGYLAVTDSGNVVFAFSLLYDIRVFSCDGKLQSRFARDVAFYGDPYEKDQFLFPPGFSGGLVQMGDDHIGQLINDVKSRRSYLDVSSVRGVYRGPIELKPPDNTPLPYLPAIAVRRDGILCVSTTDPIPMVQGFDLTRVTGLSTSQPK